VSAHLGPDENTSLIEPSTFVTFGGEHGHASMVFQHVCKNDGQAKFGPTNAPRDKGRVVQDDKFNARAGEARSVISPRSTAQLVAGRDPSRQYCKFIDVPVADGHLDRGSHSLIAAASLGVAPPLSPQALGIDCRYINIVGHDPP
jgi:hypothetical protein